MEIEITKEQEVIRAVASGIFTIQTAQKTFLELLMAVEEHKATKVLFDGRAIIGQPSTEERFEYGKFCADEIYKRKVWELFPRFAYVMNTPVLDPERFGETVAVNRGMRVKATDNLEEALKWLGFPHNS